MSICVAMIPRTARGIDEKVVAVQFALVRSAFPPKKSSWSSPGRRTASRNGERSLSHRTSGIHADALPRSYD
ncbi:MAG: hypothetical protein KatS3mg111_0799 [Pirellulaceae bacterium]|nr:MAG: hypothetical protein KatS3mg111_0799 [Pirellulaceae bacterium]